MFLKFKRAKIKQSLVLRLNARTQYIPNCLAFSQIDLGFIDRIVFDFIIQLLFECARIQLH